MIEITETSIDHPYSVQLLYELNQALYRITGNDGTHSFHNQDVMTERSVFIIAWFDGVPYGCGALRRYDDHTAEIKRVYAKKNKEGIGAAIMEYLEGKAMAFGYSRVIVETRAVNTHALQFYVRCGYSRIDGYGKYVNRKDAVCFEKIFGTEVEFPDWKRG